MTKNREKTLSPKARRTVLRRTLQAVNAADRGYVARDTLRYCVDVVGDFISIYLSALVVDGIAAGKSFGTLLFYAAIVVGIQLGLSVCQRLLFRRKDSHQFARDTGLQKRLWEKVMTMDFHHLESTDMRNRYQNAAQQPTNRNSGMPEVCTYWKFLLGGIFQVLTGVLLIAPTAFRTPVASGGFLWFLQSIWGFLTVIILASALELLKALVLGRRTTEIFARAQSDPVATAANRVAVFYDDYVLQHYQTGKEIRLYGQQSLVEEERDAVENTLFTKWGGVFRQSLAPELLFQIVNILSRVLMYGFAVVRAVSGMLSPGEVIAFALYFESISAGVSELSNAYGILQTCPTFCKAYFDFLDIPDEIYRGTIPTEKRSDNDYVFAFQDVSFRYPGTDRDVLRHVNLTWNIGEKMALVGRNGCGKSTLIKLLCRLYEPTEGVITLNGIDIRKYDYQEYMALFSVVFQDSSLFSFSLAENVAASTEYDPSRVTDCLCRAGLGDRLETLPKGIETCLYQEFDPEGVEISGGEAQKIMLARAIYKGAPFIVLDEPTAALDPISEYDIYTHFNRIVGTSTAIYISHRLSSCRFCDRIAVMANGQIVEEGNHEALLAQGGVYHDLWCAQAEYYRRTAGNLYQ